MITLFDLSFANLGPLAGWAHVPFVAVWALASALLLTRLPRLRLGAAGAASWLGYLWVATLACGLLAGGQAPLPIGPGGLGESLRLSALPGALAALLGLLGGSLLRRRSAPGSSGATLPALA